MTDAETQVSSEQLEAQDVSDGDTEGQGKKVWRRADTPTPPKDTGAAEDVEGQGFRPRGNDDAPIPPKYTGVDATESDDADVEGQTKQSRDAFKIGR